MAEYLGEEHLLSGTQTLVCIQNTFGSVKILNGCLYDLRHESNSKCYTEIVSSDLVWMFNPKLSDTCSFQPSCSICKIINKPMFNEVKCENIKAKIIKNVDRKIFTFQNKQDYPISNQFMLSNDTYKMNKKKHHDK